MIKYCTVFLSLILLLSCKKEKNSEASQQFLKSGPWRAVLELQDGEELPFLFEAFEDQTLKVFNAEEIIDVDDVKIKGDSVFIDFPVFEGYIAGVFKDSMTISGSFIKESLDRVVPITASYGVQDRFDITAEPITDITGNWEAIFSNDVEEDKYVAKGIFKQNGNIVTGTFRTTTGDYRYLEGVLNKDQLQVSAFDGAHAFLFEATVTDSTMAGNSYSGNHWQEPFSAVRNEEL